MHQTGVIIIGSDSAPQYTLVFWFTHVVRTRWLVSLVFTPHIRWFGRWMTDSWHLFFFFFFLPPSWNMLRFHPGNLNYLTSQSLRHVLCKPPAHVNVCSPARSATKTILPSDTNIFSLVIDWHRATVASQRDASHLTSYIICIFWETQWWIYNMHDTALSVLLFLIDYVAAQWFQKATGQLDSTNMKYRRPFGQIMVMVM